MRYIVLILIFFVYGLTKADGPSIFDVNYSNYPTVEAQIYFESNNELINDININDVSILENEIDVNLVDIILPNSENLLDSISVIFSIDISIDMQDKIPWIKNSITESLLRLHSFPVAISSFNRNNYLNQDFTYDRSKISKALDFLNPFGGSNLGSAFFDDFSGSISLSNRAKHKPYIFLILDKFTPIDYNLLENQLQMTDATLIIFNMTKNIPDELQSIVESTQGRVYNNIQNENILTSRLYSNLLHISNYDAVKIKYKSTVCDFLRKTDVVYKSDTNSYFSKINSELLPSLVYENGKTYSNTNLIVGTKSFFTIPVFTESDDIVIDSIIVESQNFVLEKFFESSFIFKNNRDTTIIAITPSENKYYLTEVYIYYNSCVVDTLFLSIGDDEEVQNSSNLTLIYPQGQEIFLRGQNIDIKWRGSLPEDLMTIEYSNNNGQKWNVITESATKFNYKWTIPDFLSNLYRIRLSKPSKKDILQGVIYLEHNHNKELVSHVISHDSKQIVAIYNDASISLWDIQNESILRILKNPNPGDKIISPLWNPVSKLFIAGVKNNNGTNIIIWDIDNQDNVFALGGLNSEPVGIFWNRFGDRVIAIGSDGKVYNWSLSNPNSPQIYETQITNVSNAAFNQLQNIISFSTRTGLHNLDNGNNVLLNSINFTEDILDYSWSDEINRLILTTKESGIFFFRFAFEGQDKIIRADEKLNTETSYDFCKWLNHPNFLLGSKNSNLIEVRNFDSVLFSFNGHKENLNFISTKNKLVSSSAKNNTILVWNIDSYPFLPKNLESINSGIWSVIDYDIKFNEVNIPDICEGFQEIISLSNYFQNKSLITIQIDSIIIDNPNIEVVYEESLLLKDELLDIKLIINPLDKGFYTPFIEIYSGSNVFKEKINFNVIDKGYQTVVDEYDFGAQFSGRAVNRQIATLINTSNEDLAIFTPELVFGEGFKIISPKSDVLLERGDTLKLIIEYKASDIGYFNGLIKIENSNMCSPHYINLLAKTIFPNIVFEDTLNFGIQKCENQIEKHFKIYNYSEEAIRINEIQIQDNNSFSISQINLPIDIDANDSVTINLNFNGEKFGTYDSQLLLKLLDLNIEYSINLLAIKDSSNFQFNKSNIDFGRVGINSQSEGSFIFYNNSFSELVWDIPIINDYIIIDRVEPEITAPGDSSIVFIEFMGYPNDTIINTSVILFNYCDREIKVNYFVEVREGRAILSYQNEVNLGVFDCFEEESFIIEVQNIGNINLNIENFSFKVDNPDEFVFESFDSEIQNTLRPSETGFINCRYSPKKIGNITAFLEILSNAENSEEKKNFIKIDLIQHKPNIELNNNSIIFEGIGENQSSTKKVMIKNTGTNIQFFTFLNSANYLVDYINPNPVNPNESAEVSITFKGGKSGLEYNEFILLLNQCLDEITINLAADIINDNFITIWPGSISGNTGEFVSLPIFFENTKGIDMSIPDTIFTKLVFNSTLMIPRDEKLNKNTIDSNGNRIIELAIPLRDNQLLGLYEFRLSLGDTSHSEISLHETNHLRADYFIVDNRKSSIQINNICETEVPRFINNKGLSFLKIGPSVANDIINIEFGVITDSNIEIDIYDMEGKLIEKLVNDNFNSGVYTYNYDINQLSTGNYIVRMKTKSQEFIQKITVVR